MNCPNHDGTCHRMKTVSFKVLKEHANGDVEVRKELACRFCLQTRSFTVVQQSTLTEKAHD